MSLFNPRTLDAALQSSGREPSEAERAAATDWARLAAADFDHRNESQLEADFNTRFVQAVLGYRSLDAEGSSTVMAKQPVASGTVDLALGRFGGGAAEIVAPFELKGPKSGLDVIMPGRAKTPVAQAWEYAMDAPGARWVLVSNMRELRLYAVGKGRRDHESFDLGKLDQPGALERLQLLLHADRLLSGETAALLERSARADRDITDALYRDYKALRDDLIQFVRDQRPTIDAEARIALVQKLLDRLVFTAFAEDSVLLPDETLRDVVERDDAWEDSTKWQRVCRLFAAIDRGRPKAGIEAYNGGLFEADAALDGIDLPDDLVLRFREIYGYDFKSQISVSILGHIFEQSITDIEAFQAEARGEQPPKAGKRKREGVVYTPDFVTRFIVERTIGAHLAEIDAALLAEHATGVDDEGAITWRGGDSELAFLRARLDRMAALRILDPACGSGAFLIAAFDLLHAEQKAVRDRLGEIEGGIVAHAMADADSEIITRNLFGVDVSAESVEITKLSLWLKTARKGRRLESLDHSIRWGNSLIEDSDFHRRAFTWETRFPEIMAEGGFDLVIGNPPYVRMELVKPIKPYLETRYAVASDRADLYAYFFELGLRRLKPGGRLGYISSSTFFRTGSGAKLREHLAGKAEIESVVDFGDLQIFEGVTTYPAIVTMRKKNGAAPDEALRFLHVKALPEDLSKAFDAAAEEMPRARLGAGSWRFESDRLDAIRAKMAAGRPTLAEMYGAPLYGIKTGLNEAFVLSREQRDALVARDARSADLLKPFLIGENLKRWHVESDDLWLIYTVRNGVRTEDYPAIRDHLAPFRERLEKRATKQEWWELQQAQAAYERKFAEPKIVYCDISNTNTFSLDRSGSSLANTGYFVPSDDLGLCALLNSGAAWFVFGGLTNIAQNGYLRLRTDFVGRLPVPAPLDAPQLSSASEQAHAAASALTSLIDQVLHRLADVAPAAETIAAFRAWPDLHFAGLRALLAKRCKADFPVAERDQWEAWFAARRAEAADLRTRITDAEAEINDRVYRLFDLDADEIAAIEEALAGQY